MFVLFRDVGCPDDPRGLMSSAHGYTGVELTAQGGSSRTGAPGTAAQASTGLHHGGALLRALLGLSLMGDRSYGG